MKCYVVEASKDNGATWSDLYPGTHAYSKIVAEDIARAAKLDGKTVRVVERDDNLGE